MPDVFTTGTSVNAYQEVIQFPNNYPRLFFYLPEADWRIPILKGHLIVSQRFASDSYNQDNVWRVIPIWGQGVVIQDIPPVLGDDPVIWVGAVQWRSPGLYWEAYADTFPA